MYVLSYLPRRKSIIMIECRKKRAKAINGDRIFKKIFAKAKLITMCFDWIIGFFTE